MGMAQPTKLPCVARNNTEKNLCIQTPAAAVLATPFMLVVHKIFLEGLLPTPIDIKESMEKLAIIEKGTIFLCMLAFTYSLHI
jgi:hypothetical protein